MEIETRDISQHLRLLSKSHEGRAFAARENGASATEAMESAKHLLIAACILEQSGVEKRGYNVPVRLLEVAS